MHLIYLLGVCLFSYLNRPPVPSRNKDAVPLVVKCVQAAASAIATIVDLPYDTLSFDSVKVHASQLSLYSYILLT